MGGLQPDRARHARPGRSPGLPMPAAVPQVRFARRLAGATSDAQVRGRDVDAIKEPRREAGVLPGG